jgi:hypothetical protein
MHKVCVHVLNHFLPDFDDKTLKQSFHHFYSFLNDISLNTLKRCIEKESDNY